MSYEQNILQLLLYYYTYEHFVTCEVRILCLRINVMRVVNISGNTTLGSYEYNIIAKLSSATLTVTLPSASTVGQIIFIGSDSYTTIASAGSDVIRLQGAPTGVSQPIYEYTSIYLIS